MRERRVASTKVARQYVIFSGVFALLFAVLLLTSVFGHSRVDCYRGVCTRLSSVQMQIRSWWFAVALVLLLAMFCRDVVLWRQSVRLASENSAPVDGPVIGAVQE